MNELANQCFPLKKGSRKALKEKPWITDEIINSIKIPNKLFKIYKKKHTVKSESEFKRYRNKLNHLKETGKKTYFQKLFDECKNDTSKTWKNLNQLMRKKSSKNGLIPKLEWRSKIYSESQDVNNVFNEHFTKVAESLLEKLKPSSCDIISFVKKLIANSVFLAITDMYEVIHLINSNLLAMT